MKRLAKVTGDCIKLLRITNGISKAALANKIGVSIYFVNKIEKGEMQLKGNVIIRLAKVFKMKTAAFALIIGSMYDARYSGKRHDAKEKLLLRTFGKIYKDLRRKKGLSMVQVANKSNVSVVNIRNIEQGVIAYHQPVWKAISLAIGYELSDVMELVYKDLKISLR
jgi:transcriptional regulator with XRE-family HTH domain